METSDWIQIRSVSNTSVVDALRLDLDLGESETIALALELKADLVLLDEQIARRAAQYLTLKVMGIVGLLIRAKKIGILQEVRPMLDLLRQQAGFYLNQAVYDHAIQLANE